jgi:hypothetical protein
MQRTGKTFEETLAEQDTYYGTHKSITKTIKLLQCTIRPECTYLQCKSNIRFSAVMLYLVYRSHPSPGLEKMTSHVDSRLLQSYGTETSDDVIRV